MSLVTADPSDPFRAIGGMGKGQRVLGTDEEAVLFEHTGTGCLTHFWFGGNFEGAENTRIRYYINGQSSPSISMNLFMGHGIGFGDQYAPWVTRYMGKVGKHNGIHNQYRIPFQSGIRVTAQRAADVRDNPQVWWIIRGVEHGRARIGGVVLPPDAQLRLHRVEDYLARPLEEFDLCRIEGRGAVYQVAIAARSQSLSYLEACVRAYLGRETRPLMLSSGLEDYFLGTYYFDSGRYYSDIAGLTHFSREQSSFSAYRFHDEDPLFFRDGLRLTCRCGETEHGAPGEVKSYLDPLPTRYTTYTWVYQW